MIAKLAKGRGFRGALEYDLEREKGILLDTNMAGENPRELAQEFGAIRELRPGLGKAVFPRLPLRRPRRTAHRRAMAGDRPGVFRRHGFHR